MIENMVSILLVEDEPEIRRFLRIALVNNGFELIETARGAEGLEALATRKPDLIILDLGLPDMDGVDFTRRVRSWSQIPIIVLSARSMEKDKIEALDAGADDFVTKPFGVLELMARIRVSMRRINSGSEVDLVPVFKSGNLEVDLSKRKVSLGGKEIHLTPTEYEILKMLVRNADRVVTQSAILREIWGAGATTRSHYLRVYLGQLRHKIEIEPARPRYLITEPGVGYRLRVLGEEP